LIPKRRSPKDPDAFRNIGVHPLIYKILAHQAIEEGQTLRDLLHGILCRELDRRDLMIQMSDRVETS
jgi:hypothetical protein